MIYDFSERETWWEWLGAELRGDPINIENYLLEIHEVCYCTRGWGKDEASNAIAAEWSVFGGEK